MTRSTIVGRGCLRARRVLLTATTILASCGAIAPAMAQFRPVATPPNHLSLDPNEVDLVSGQFVTSATDASIGPDERSGIALVRTITAGGWTSNFIGQLIDTSSSGSVTVSFGDHSTTFTYSGSTLVPTDGSGTKLVQLSGGFYWEYTLEDGTVITFDTSSTVDVNDVNLGRAVSVKYPNGEQTNFNFITETVCSSTDDPCPSYFTGRRLQSVTNNRGYQAKIDYLTNAPTGATIGTDWISPTKITLFNRTVDACDPYASTCTFSRAWPNATYSGSFSYPYVITSVTDAVGNATQYTFNAAAGGLSGIKRPGASSDHVSITYDSNARVSTFTKNGVTWNYAWSETTTDRAVVVTGPASYQRTVVSDIATSRVKTDTDALSRTTSYQHDASGRVTRVTQPETNYVQLSYDGRGNVTETRRVTKSGSGLADIVTSAAYDSTCSNPKTCNKPNSTTDTRGKTTDYAYDSTHGGLLSVTAPAPSSSAVRPQTRISYDGQQAYYKNGAGSIVASGQTIYLMSEVSACQTTASCTGGSDESKTTMSYGPQTSGVGNNLLPVGTASGSGNGSLTATVAGTYDAVGDLSTLDGPLSGTEDTTRTIYDANRRVVGVIGPDPDGGGVLKHRAVKYSHNADSQVTAVARGTTNGQTDTDWAGFTALQQRNSSYDVNARTVRDELASGGTAYSVQHYGYDALGRLECSALRMNSATWSALPSSACALGNTGSFGPDRIGKTSYNAASEVTKVQSAYGTSDVADEISATYSSNGRLATATDAKGNRTTYEYDGHDRVTKTRYPLASTPGSSSTTDYVQPTYDAGSNITSLRLRDGQSIGFTYDDLSRMVAKDLPGSELDVTYGYDNLGRLTLVDRPGTSGWTMPFGYDALNRLTSETSPLGTTSYGYDLAGRRTQLTYSDGFYVTEEHLVTGETSAIRENGSAALATFTYDDLGRRTRLDRGNGTYATYGRDTVSRLTALVDDQGGIGYDQTLSFTHNPVGQIATRSASNDAYAFSGFANQNLAETPNGLNQLVSQGSTSLSHDGRGNVSAIGGTAYGFTSENFLASGGSLGLSYDPLGRLYQLSSGVAFNHGGDVLLSEHSSGGIAKRYVHGPGADEPLAEYSGSGLATKRWFHADERGSVTAITDVSGANVQVNSYDSYGVPASGNAGRFQYTGQAWLPELGMAYYKARIYAPAIGRFLQTDPIGYGAGMNLYAYVKGDPINKVDPTGLARSPATGEKPEAVAIDGGDIINVFGDRFPCLACDAPPSIGFVAPFMFDNFATGVADSVGDTSGQQQEKTCPKGSSLSTPAGNSLGNGSRQGDNRATVNTALPGGWGDAGAKFWELSREAGDFSYSVPNEGLLSRKVGGVLRGFPSGITLRVGRDQGLQFSPRVDVPVNSGLTTRPVTIHFRQSKAEDEC